MGYDLHITRRKRWSERGHDITAHEWVAYVSADPELSLQPTHSRYFAVWSGESQLDQPWLDWADGQIFTPSILIQRSSPKWRKSLASSAAPCRGTTERLTGPALRRCSSRSRQYASVSRPGSAAVKADELSRHRNRHFSFLSVSSWVVIHASSNQTMQPTASPRTASLFDD